MNLDHPVTIIISFANLAVLIGVYNKISVLTYQHRLMWRDYAKRKDIDENSTGKSMAGL